MRPIPSERRGHDTAKSKRMITILTFLPTRLAPRNELAQVAQIVTNRDRAHILRVLQVRLILVQRLAASTREGRLACSLHHILPSKALADMRKRDYLEH